MLIGGLVKTTLVDYPSKVAAIVFTAGCNFRCHFCYNPMLVWPRDKAAGNKNKRGHSKQEAELRAPLLPENGLFQFLKLRQEKLEGIVITGGEPTIFPDLPEFIAKIKALGYAVKLDTNGTNPAMIKKLLKNKLIDYLAMDLKGPALKYAAITGRPINFKKILESVKIIMASGLPYEFRTTMVPGLLEPADIPVMGKIIKGAHAWYLQKFKSDVELVDSQLQLAPPFSDQLMKQMALAGQKYVKLCAWR